MSMCLSEILSDIGLNEEMVLKRRRAWLQRESLATLAHRLKGIQQTIYMFGSLTEGTTTFGMRSDNDMLIYYDIHNVVSGIEDCKPEKINLLVFSEVSTPPGYCLLSQVQRDTPFHRLKQTLLPHGLFQIFFNYLNAIDDNEYKLHGPALRVKGRFDPNDQDYVYAYHCQAWPSSARTWLTEEGIGGWPTKEMKSFAETNGCFLVGVGSKGSDMEQYEYRISTSLAERCLMFSLNITQIRCYVLMKMIIKTFIHPCGDSIITSYMCKTVLFHCIQHTYSTLWQESELLYCLTLCLSALQYCVLIGNCPHFIIRENNSMEGRFTKEFRTVFIEQMRHIILDNGLSLRHAEYDELGIRLQCKMKHVSRNMDSIYHLPRLGLIVLASYCVTLARVFKIFIRSSYPLQCMKM
ncbi:uncharacterized protein LOC128549230 [Mercenaria mercenaria]|uniref:uncharacterized protein LOC128549230 n=1 Tax=Mercenaria mercenaria TaxID=6596 RepID=UPI00234F803E|nr:uncharacterized protein LOC128549230 [Mercenaria mercenaria]